MPSFCIRSMFSRILAALCRSYSPPASASDAAAVAVSGDTGVVPGASAGAGFFGGRPRRLGAGDRSAGVETAVAMALRAAGGEARGLGLGYFSGAGRAAGFIGKGAAPARPIGRRRSGGERGGRSGKHNGHMGGGRAGWRACGFMGGMG